MKNRLLLAVFFVLVGVLAPVLNQPEHVSACSLAGFPDSQTRLLRQTSVAGLIIVGWVEDEQPMAGFPQLYASKVRPQAVLKGETQRGPTDLSHLGALSPSCTGAPRLRKGESVLLFLELGAPASNSSFRFFEGGWRVALAGQGSYLFRDGFAWYLMDHYDSDRLENVGPSEDFMRELATLAGSTPEQLEASLKVIREGSSGVLQEAGPSADQDRDSPEVSDGTPGVIAFVGLSLLLASLVALAKSLKLYR